MTFEVSSCNKFQIFRGSAPDPVGGAYSAPPDILAGGEGLATHPQEPHFLLSALRASSFGFVPLAVRDKISPLQNKFELTPLLPWDQCLNGICLKTSILTVNRCSKLKTRLNWPVCPAGQSTQATWRSRSWTQLLFDGQGHGWQSSGVPSVGVP